MILALTSILAWIGSVGSLETIFSEKPERIISKNTLVTTIPELGKEWRVSFEVKPAIYVEAEYQNVLHLTIGGDAKEYGDRTPAVWIHPEKGIMISSAVNGTSDYGFFCKKHLPSADKWTRYAVEQVMNEEEEEYVYSIFINDVEKHSGVNKQPEAFSDVGVYASNPWDPNPKNQATIRNLEIKSTATRIGLRGSFTPRDDGVSIAEREKGDKTKNDVEDTIPETKDPKVIGKEKNVRREKDDERREQNGNDNNPAVKSNETEIGTNGTVIIAIVSAAGGVLVTLLLIVAFVMIKRARRRGDRVIQDLKEEENSDYGIYYTSEGQRIDQSTMEIRNNNSLYGCDD